MKNTTNDMVRRLSFENWIWVCFIVISILDIYGDELLKRSITINDKESQEKAQKIFLGVGIVSILIYIYFFIRNYSDYKRYHNKSYEIRLIGSILILTGTICLLYFQLTTIRQNDSPSNI